MNRLIVKHFPDIKDRLLNIIELSKIGENLYSPDIINASIDQKISEIKIFNFQKAINFGQLKFIFIYFIISIGIVFGIMIFDKPLIAESNYRIINYDKNFSKPAPYEFILQNESLSVNKGDEFSIYMVCKGENLPQVVYINIEGNNFLMKKKDNNHFEYHLESVINSFDFYFTDLKYFSENYSLKTVPKPGISEFIVKINPPAYTRTEQETFNNIGDFKIPEGTEIEWNFKCIDTDSLYIFFSEADRTNATKRDNWLKVSKNIYDNSEYNIFIKNSHIDYNEVLTYSLTVIPDMFPEIKVVQSRDSFKYSRFYFKGEIADDYGFTSLNFHINANNQDSIFPLEVVHNLVNQDFYYTVDFNSFNFGSEEVSYYFSVTDNDQVNGPKSTTSNSFIYKAPTLQEITKQDKEQFSQIENMVSETQQLAKEIKEGLKELQYKSLDSKVTDWEKSQLVNEIVNKKNQLEKLVDQVKKQNQDLNNLVNSFNKQDKEVLEKQEMLEKLLEEVFSDDLKKLLEEFSKLAEEFKKDKFNELSEKLDMSVDNLSKQLDRNLEMLRKMKVEQKLQDVIEKMYQLANKEEQLSQEIGEEKNYEDVLKKDMENKQNLDNLRENLNDALELNKELKKPLNYDSFEEDFKNINQSFDENKDNLEKKNRKKSSQSIKNASEQIKSLAFNMDQLLKSNTIKQKGENIENIKQILSNLIYFSFAQEDVMAQLTGIEINDPFLNLLKRTQKNLKDQSAVIKDSLYTLASRTPEISNMINNELLNIDINLIKTLKALDDGLIPNSRMDQQFIITSVNNLALLLNEALDQLEKQMAENMKGDQECENPGQGKGGKNMDMLKQSSESIKQRLQQMIEEMKKGNSKGLSKMLGQSLMQHEMMQQMLRELTNNGSVGSDAKSQLQNIDKLLEETRQELINKSVSEKTLLRQNQIQTRLLEAEKSEIERDFDNKRESEAADDKFYSNPVKYFEYKKPADSGLENLEQNMFKLNSFYNKKYKKYLNTIDGQGTR